MKRTLLVLFILLSLPLSIFATPNNKFGISLAQPQFQDIQAASDLVNSNGGKWGYVTLIVQENDRNREKWQGIFDQLRELHLIPIIRLATQPEGENWRRPEEKDAKDWVDFLDSLNWVVKNRYVILFNEPNHGSEWGGEVDVKSYTAVSLEFAKKLKEKNKDFFVMLAGFDASAPSWWPGMEDEEIFLKKMFSVGANFNSPDKRAIQESPLQEYIDGLASHSYPNPGFAGLPYGWGRGSVRTYEWELGMLQGLGVTKELPVFITETGWKRGNEDTVASNFQTVYQSVWEQDPRVKAVTPFVLDYQGPPFLEFSWKKYQMDAFYQQYYTVQSLTKIKGEPEQTDKGKINFDLPVELVAQSKYDFKVILKNSGQAIWDISDDYELRITDYGLKDTNTLIADLKDIKPFEEKSINFSLKTNEENVDQEIKFSLIKNNTVVLESKLWRFKVLPLPDLNIEANLWPFRKGKEDDFEIQIFDTDDRVVLKKKGISLSNGKEVIKNVQNIAIDELYRIVILKHGYLPRQTFIVFQTTDNLAKFKSLLPFDFNSDGTFNFKDIISIFKKNDR